MTEDSIVNKEYKKRKKEKKKRKSIHLTHKTLMV